MNLSALHTAIRSTVTKQVADDEALAGLSSAESAALGSWQHRLNSVGGDVNALQPAAPMEEWQAPPPVPEANLG